jgi:hypothetical protein
LKASKQLTDEIEAKIKEKLNLAWGGTGITKEEPAASKENA